MRRVDFGGGGWFVRIGRWWMGLTASWPFVSRIPVIAGGSDGMPAQGSYLLIDNGASPMGYIEIAEVTNIGGGGDTSERIDFTHLRSPGRTREYKPSFIEAGVLTFTIQYIPTDTSHLRILALHQSGEEVSLREVFPDATGWDYMGYISAVEKAGQDVGGKIVLNISYQRTGVIDYSGIGSP